MGFRGLGFRVYGRGFRRLERVQFSVCHGGFPAVRLFEFRVWGFRV